jgi:uncharacterized membrane protein
MSEDGSTTISTRERRPRSFAARTRRYLLVGVLTLIPLAVTWFVIDILVNLLSRIGKPFVRALAALIEPVSPAASQWVADTTFQSALAIVVVVLVIYGIGWAASRVVGARILGFFEGFVERIPFVQNIYSSTKRLLSVLQQKPNGLQRIVLIEFPSPDMKTIGLVTRTFKDEATGEELAAVYVPTTPNPTSGYLEIVPVANVVSTTWTMDEAMSFIISGGAVAPSEELTFSTSRGPRLSSDKKDDTSAND